MRNWLLLAVVVGISASLFAQVPVPGTFTTVPVQQVQAGTPILSTPIGSLGNGLTPAVVTNKQTYVIGAPQNVSLPPDLVAGTTQTGAAVQAVEPTTQAGGTAQVATSRPFEWGAASESVATAEVDNRSLAEVARSMKKSGAGGFTGRTITNDDVNRINQQHPAGAVPAEQQPGQQPQQQPQQPQQNPSAVQ